MAKVQKKQKLQKNKIIAKLLIIFGILLFLFGLITHTEIYYRYLLSKREKQITYFLNNTPIRLSIPSLKIDINVDQGGIVDGNWVLSDTDALYLPTSGRLGEGFNTIIYAHNTKNLFGRLKSIKPGELIIVKDRSGKEYRYRVFLRENTDPKNLQGLYSEEKNIITLFTCDGWADSERLLVKARILKK